jgi:hypothetical protein
MAAMDGFYGQVTDDFPSYFNIVEVGMSYLLFLTLFVGSSEFLYCCFVFVFYKGKPVRYKIRPRGCSIVHCMLTELKEISTNQCKLL